MQSRMECPNTTSRFSVCDSGPALSSAAVRTQAARMGPAAPQGQAVPALASAVAAQDAGVLTGLPKTTGASPRYHVSRSCYCPSPRSSLDQYFIRGLLIELRGRWCCAFGGFLMRSRDAIFRGTTGEWLVACVEEMITRIFSGPSNQRGKERIG